MPKLLTGDTAPEPKKKKPSVESRVEATAEKVSTPGTKARREAPATTPQTRRAARENIIVNDLKPYVHDRVDKEYRKAFGPQYTSLQDDEQANLVANASTTYLQDVSTRATQLTPGFMRDNPSLAGDLLLSGIPTKDLRKASEAVYEGYKQMRGEWMVKQQNHAAGIGVGGPSPDELAAFVGTQAAAAASGSTGLTGEASGDMSFGEGVVHGAGVALSLPFKAAGSVGGAAGRAVGAEGITENIGGYARNLEGFAGNAIHFAQGVATTALTTPLSIWDIAHGDMPRYLHEWGHEGIAPEIFEDITGLDAEDYQGLTQGFQLVADIGASEGLLRLGGAIKLGHTDVPTVKGRYGGENFMADQGTGVKLGNATWDLLKDLPDGAARRTVLMGKFKSMVPPLAEELSRAVTKDDVLRTYADWIDNSATRTLPKALSRLDEVKGELKNIAKGQRIEESSPVVMSSQADIGRIGMDDGTYVYRIDSVGSAESIATRGIDPMRSSTGKAYFSDDPFKTYDLSDRVTSQGAGGAEFNIYRVKKDLTTLEQPGEWVTGEVVPPASTEVFTEGGWQTVKPGAAIDPSIIDTTVALEAEKTFLEQRVSDLNKQIPLFELPKKSEMQAFMRGVPRNTRVGRALQAVFSEGRPADLSKFSNDFSPRDARRYSPFDADKPYDWAEHNVKAYRLEANVAKVPKDIQAGVIESMFNIRTKQDFFRWEKEVNRSFRGGLTRGGRRNSDLIPNLDEILQISERTAEERISSPALRSADLPNGRTISTTENALLGKDGQPIPNIPSYFRESGEFPDIGLLQDASSTVRYVDHWAKQNPWIGKTYEHLMLPVRAAKFAALTLPRLIMRPIVLTTRIIPMAFKIQMDQGLRSYLMDYTRPLWKRNGVDYGPAGIPKVAGKTPTSALYEDKTAFGLVAEETEAVLETATTRVNTRNITSASERGPIAYSQAMKIAEYSNDRVMNRFAAYGPDEILPFLESHPNFQGGWWKNTMKPLLEEQGLTPDDWVRSMDDSLNYVTGGDPAIRDAIATKEWSVGRPVDTGATIERTHLLDEIEEARSARAVEENGIKRQEWGHRIDTLEERLNRMEKSVKLSGSDTISIKDVDLVSGEIQNLWADGKYQMPDEVLVKRNVVPEKTTGATRLDRARELAQRTNKFLYKGLRPLTKYDVTRESTYRAVLDKTYTDLINRGYEPGLALEIGQVRASMITKDLHYDITARSSFDRRMKDYFWFSAVWREQMTTYLYKIPSKSYWPVGLPLRTFEAYSLIDGLHELGLLEWDDWQNSQGETGRNVVLNVPWISDFIGKLQHNEEAGKINVGGLNPLTPGTAGILPTLSPSAESILDLTAANVPKSWRPFFEYSADLFTFDQDPNKGPNYFPSAVIAVGEAMGMHIPFDTLNFDDWRNAENKGNIQGLRWAASDLASEGVLPPHYPGDYADEAELEKWEQEKDAYNKKLLAHAHDYTFTSGMLHVIGSVILPGQFTRAGGVTDEGQAFYDFMDPIREAADNGEITVDEMFARQNQYISDHPASWIYSVGAHPGRYGTPTYDSEKYIDADDFTDKALKQTLYWMETPDDLTSDPSIPVGEHEDIDRKKTERNIVNLAADPDLNQLEPEHLDQLGIPEFNGRDEMVAEINHVYKNFNRVYSSELTDDEKARVIEARDNALSRIADPYGPEGQRVLKFYRSTPAERLRGIGYFHTNFANQSINQAQSVARAATEAGSSPMYAAESTGVLADKIELYRGIERLRASNPAFDRELRRAEVTLGEKDTTKGRVALYEWLFFNQPDDLFGYQAPIVRGLNG